MIRLTKNNKDHVKSLLFSDIPSTRELAKCMLTKGQLLHLYKERLFDIINDGAYTELISSTYAITGVVTTYHIKFPNFEPLDRLWFTIAVVTTPVPNCPFKIGIAVTGRLYESEAITVHNNSTITRSKIERIYESTTWSVEELRAAYITAIEERFACWKKLHYNNT